LIIGGINIFFPRSLVVASAHVEGAVEERQPAKNVKEEQELKLKYSQEMEEENYVELLKSFSKGDEQEMNVKLEPTTEEREINRQHGFCLSI
jgi:hypothetical protein